MPIGLGNFIDYFNNLPSSEGDYDHIKMSFLPNSIIPKNRFIYEGKGCTLQTNRGKTIDLGSMTVNCILGQNDSWVNKNIAGYILSKQPSFHSSSFSSATYLSYPYRLSKLQIANIANPVINHKQCNGSDVVELAIASASLHKGRKNKIISFKGSYHGQNLTSYIISEIQNKFIFIDPATREDIIFLDPPPNSSGIDANILLTVREQNLLSQIEMLGDEAYACIIEPIQVNNFVNVFSWAFMHGLEQVCKKKNICLIFDEIQTGWGWLGKLSAAEVYGVKPNIALFGKALTAGNGPLAIMIADQKYRNQQYGTSEKTNGADPRSLVAAHAVLDRLIGLDGNLVRYWENKTRQILPEELKHGLLEKRFKKVNKLLEAELVKLQSCHPYHIGKITGYGLIRGIEILNNQGNPDLEKTQRFTQACYQQGVFVRHSRRGVVIIKPPIVISEEELREAFKIMSEVINEIF